MMNFNRILFGTLLLYVTFSLSCKAQSSRIIVLGDIHYDLAGDHDIAWLKNKPDDIRQIKEYTAYTVTYWNDFMQTLRNTVAKKSEPSALIIQLGDLSEGLAGSPAKAREMASHTMEAVEQAHTGIPWLLVKGNHDITGPGAPEAFLEYYIPMIRNQTKNSNIGSANYSYISGNVQVTCVDPWDKTVDIVDFLDKELSHSTALVKFVAIHEPVIPVTERCWHVLRNEPEKRQKLLEVIARNKAIVLCGHLHKYSVVKRNTDFGPVVQVMVVSVITDRNYLAPARLITTYGPSLVDDVPLWEPASSAQRKAWLTEEAKFVTYYKQTDLPGYAVFKIDAQGKNVVMEYYAAFGKKPYDVVNISELMK
jgi:UDP-2,3-diacylglucosamine pyrophosphatase LpxH